MQNSKNITPEAIEESVGVNPSKSNNGVFDAKNYLNVRLGKNEDEKNMKIRLLTIDKDSNSPFKHIYMHTVAVPKEVSESGWKSYVCLEKTEGEYSEKLGHKCPFCELKREAYNKSQEAKKAAEKAKYDGNSEEESKQLAIAERYKKISIANIPNEVGIIRCIERGHEEDGPKFWKFSIRKDKKDPENVIRKLYTNRKEECIEEGVEPENILDIDTGRDLKVTVEAVYDNNGKRTNKTSVNITTFGNPKPLTTDNKQRDAWINDEKIWSDVFVAKPYEYLEVIIDGGIPWFDRTSGKWIPKKVFEKNTGVNPADVDNANAKVNEAKAQTLKQTETVNDDSEKEEDLPF